MNTAPPTAVGLLGSPIWKSLNDVMPVAIAVVAVLPPSPVADQFGSSYFLVMKSPKEAPPSTSSGRNVNVALAVPKPMPLLVRL